MTDEREPSELERLIASRLAGELIHPHRWPGEHDYWTHTLDANSRHKVARLAIEAMRDRPTPTAREVMSNDAYEVVVAALVKKVAEMGEPDVAALVLWGIEAIVRVVVADCALLAEGILTVDQMRAWVDDVADDEQRCELCTALVGHRHVDLCPRYGPNVYVESATEDGVGP